MMGWEKTLHNFGICRPSRTLVRFPAHPCQVRWALWEQLLPAYQGLWAPSLSRWVLRLSERIQVDGSTSKTPPFSFIPRLAILYLLFISVRPQSKTDGPFFKYFNVLKCHLHTTVPISISESRVRPAGTLEIPIFKVLVLM